MREKLTSEGQCIYCGEMFKQSGMVRHLATHLSAMEKETEANVMAYHLNIHAGEMFLQVLVKGSASFKTLDTFLRKIWVDCCDHMSDFHHKNFRIRKSQSFADVLSPRLKFEYRYDYGSTTEFSIQVAAAYKIDPKKDLVLLSRNEPLKFVCRTCNEKPATSICTTHMYESDECLFCNECAAKHGDECEDFLNYAEMPVVNSPRMGVCGYTGGSIDKARDGGYKGQV